MGIPVPHTKEEIRAELCSIGKRLAQLHQQHRLLTAIDGAAGYFDRLEPDGDGGLCTPPPIEHALKVDTPNGVSREHLRDQIAWLERRRTYLCKRLKDLQPPPTAQQKRKNTTHGIAMALLLPLGGVVFVLAVFPLFAIAISAAFPFIALVLVIALIRNACRHRRSSRA